MSMQVTSMKYKQLYAYYIEQLLMELPLELFFFLLDIKDKLFIMHLWLSSCLPNSNTEIG